MDTEIDLIGAEWGFLILIDSDTTNLDLRAAKNIERETLKCKDIEISRTGSVLRIKKPNHTNSSDQRMQQLVRYQVGD